MPAWLLLLLAWVFGPLLLLVLLDLRHRGCDPRRRDFDRWEREVAS